MADEALVQELAGLRRVLDKHFAGDDEFQGGLARDVREIRGSVEVLRGEVATLRTEVATQKVRHEEQQSRWRKLLDPAEGGELVPPQRSAPRPELNGMLKVIVGVAAGAGGAAGLIFEAIRWLAANLPHN